MRKLGDEFDTVLGAQRILIFELRDEKTEKCGLVRAQFIAAGSSSRGGYPDANFFGTNFAVAGSFGGNFEMALIGQRGAINYMRLDVSEAPRFHDWMARIKQRPSYAQALTLSHTGAPETAFAPGPEHSRWG